MWFKVIQFVLKWWKPAVGIIGLVALSIVPSCFDKPKDIKVNSGGTYVEASEGYEATFGCATGRQFLGWAHKK